MPMLPRPDPKNWRHVRGRKHTVTVWRNGQPLISKEIVCTLYQTGLSTRQIAQQLQRSPTRIAKIVSTAGLTRTRETAAVLRQKATSTHWRSTRAAARKLWVRTYGAIPPKHHVHHKDGDCTNNKIENLEVLSASAHSKLHHPKNPIPREQRPSRVAYRTRYREMAQKKKRA